MKVALIHYWLTGMRGGEKVLEAFCRRFPQADIFTHALDRKRLSGTLKAHRIHPTWIAKLPFARRAPQAYLPLMPRALEGLDLRGYDLVISSEAGPAKGIIPPPDAPHLCYVHSPMRYIWDQYPIYHAESGPLGRLAMGTFAHGLRQWDVTSAARVDHFWANSAHVADRVQKYWRRPAEVLHPPVDIRKFSPVLPKKREAYFLWAGELAPYKRPDLAIEAFRRLGLPLRMIGGPEKTRARLAATAPANVQLLGRVSDAALHHHLSHARALIFPGEEDFGILPVEALASGRPVIAYGRGGALDSLRHGETGFFFHDQTPEALVDAVEAFIADGLEKADPWALAKAAKRFDEVHFQDALELSLRRLGINLPQTDLG